MEDEQAGKSIRKRGFLSDSDSEEDDGELPAVNNWKINGLQQLNTPFLGMLMRRKTLLSHATLAPYIPAKSSLGPSPHFPVPHRSQTGTQWSGSVHCASFVSMHNIKAFSYSQQDCH